MRRRPIAPASLKEDDLADLVARTRAGDREAWANLWLTLAPLVENVARRWQVTDRLSQSPDDRSDIVLRVMGELHADNFCLLADLGERLACRDGSFRRWLWILARNLAVSHVREHPEYLGPTEGGAGRWANHVPIPDTLDDDHPPPSVSRRIAVRHILACSLDLLDPPQLAALDRWLQGDDFTEIAVALQQGGDAESAARLVRSAVKRLRDRFAAENRVGAPTNQRASSRRTARPAGSN